MCRAIDAAQSEILLESYILKDDTTGRGFLEALASARSRGVSVRVLADFFGSFATRRAFWAEMRRRGIEVRLFNPRFPHLRLSALSRPPQDPRRRSARGLHRRNEHRRRIRIGSRIPPRPLARHARAGRGHDRVGDGDRLLGGLEALGRRPARARASREEPRGAGLHPDTRLAPRPRARRDGRRPLGHRRRGTPSRSGSPTPTSRRAVAPSSFSPRRRAAASTCACCCRGGPTSPSSATPGTATFGGCSGGGVRVFEYRAAILHAKALVADDFVSVVGSTNLDFRSFHFNAECNLVILDDDVGRRPRRGLRRRPDPLDRDHSARTGAGGGRSTRSATPPRGCSRQSSDPPSKIAQEERPGAGTATFVPSRGRQRHGLGPGRRVTISRAFSLLPEAV